MEDELIRITVETFEPNVITSPPTDIMFELDFISDQLLTSAHGLAGQASKQKYGLFCIMSLRC